MVVVGRRVVEPPVEVPMVEVMVPVVGEAKTAAAVDVGGAIAATAERHAAATDTGGMKSATAATETASAMTAVTAANFDRHSFGRVFRYRQRTRTCQRKRFSSLLWRG